MPSTSSAERNIATEDVASERQILGRPLCSVYLSSKISTINRMILETLCEPLQRRPYFKYT